MSSMNFKVFEGTPCVSLKLDGGIGVWQDWMCDSISLMASGEGDKADSMICFSFIAGNILSKTSVTPEIFKNFSQAECHALISEDLGEAQAFEGILVKNEQFDCTGYFQKGIKLQTRGDLAGALSAYEEAQKNTTKLSRISNLMGLCLKLLNKIPQAEQAYLKEIEISPMIPDAYCNLGVLYLRTNREQLARTMFEKALARDQFYLNALIQMSKILSQTDEIKSKLFSSVNFRLMVAFSEIPQVQNHLLELAKKLGLSPTDFSATIRSEAGLLSDPSILQLIKRVEALRLNGGIIAAVRGFMHLLEKTVSSPVEGFFLNWIAKRMEILSRTVPKFLNRAWEKVSGELSARYPAISKQDLSVEPEVKARSQALTPEEFFEIVLTEVMRDGKISPSETQIIFRLKNALRIDEKVHQRIFSEVESRTKNNLQVDDGGDFDPKRVFKQLVLAVIRDKNIEPSEKKLLSVAGEALEILPEEAKGILAEIAK